jgi:hypothetical protein
MMMCVRLGFPALLPLLFATLATSLLLPVFWRAPAHAQLLDGITRYADTTVGVSSTKWAGQRVPFPLPRPRPAVSQHLTSVVWPLSVHAGAEVAPARVLAVLAAGERTLAALSESELLASFGDAGQGSSAGLDLYLVQDSAAVASAALDATGNFTALDGARAYALLDARVPASRLFACTAQALLDAQLFELDPAEATSVRTSSAAYLAGLLSGESCEDVSPELHLNPFLVNAATGAAWLAQLSARQDHNRGTFVFELWQFARQRTWEGEGLRASPDLMEVLDKTLELSRESFALLAAELAEGRARLTPGQVRSLPASALPFFSPRSDPALGVLGSKHVRIELGTPRAGSRLRAFARGEAGGSYVLSAQRLDVRGDVLARLELAPRSRDPNGQLSIELDGATTAVVVTVTRYADQGVPDPDSFDPTDLRPVGLTIDLAP